MNRFKELDVWKKAVDLSLDIYKMTDSFPEKEKFNLIGAAFLFLLTLQKVQAEMGRKILVDFCQ